MLQARALQPRCGGKDPQGAAALYRKVIELVPDSSQAQLRLSEAILETGDLDGAIPPAVKATELDPHSGEAWAHLALLRYYTAGSGPAALAQAIQALRKATRLLPGDPELWTRLAEVQETAKDEAGALQAWIRVGRLHPVPTYRGRVLWEYAYERAVEISVRLKAYDARREAALALCDRPNPEERHLRILEELARDQVDAGFLGHAEESFTKLAQYVPKEPAIWENIALIRLRTSRWEPALEALRKAESIRTTPRIAFNTGYCLMKLGRHAEAEARWKALLPVLADATGDDATLDVPAKVLYASCLILQGRPGEMLKLEASWPDPDKEGERAALRAQALIQTRAWKEVRPLLKDGVARFPKQEIFRKAGLLPPKILDPGASFKAEYGTALEQLDLEGMAALWSEFNGWEQCLAAVREARRQGRILGVDMSLMEANALQSLGRDAESMQVLREAQRVEPGNPTLQNNLGYLLLESGGDVAEASRLIRAALDQEPGNSSTMDSWGWALYKQGKYREAEEALRKAVAASPFSPESHKHLGEALLKLDRLQEALEEWERALAFVFPERGQLEKQVQDLRVLAARRSRQGDEEEAAQPGQTAQPDPDEQDDDDGEGQ
jgi:tetratricopeptide (TPR) repeat protein